MANLNVYPRFSILILCFFIISACNGQDPSTISEVVSSQEVVQMLTAKNDKPIDERVQLFNQLKNQYPKAFDSSTEDVMNMYGYSLLWEGKANEAIEIFKLLTTEFPLSANTYDSLAEAYLANGNKKLALDNYEKTLALNPSNFNAEDQIDRIKNPNKKKLSPQEKFSITFTNQEYKDDLDQLANSLLETHPNALKFITKADFTQLVERKKSLISENTTHAQFMWHCSEIIASVNCSHTTMGRFWNENQALPSDLRFPLQVRWIDGKMFVTKISKEEKSVNLKDQITHINGRPALDIITKIYNHIASQGYVETAKKHNFNRWSTGMIPYELGFPKSYSIQIKGKKDPITLSPSTFDARPIRDHSIEDCGADLCLDFLSDQKSALMTISSFNYYNWNNFHEFEAFIDHSMKEIQLKNIENLVIDLRSNGGGSPESSIHLLKYLIGSKFIYYSKAEYEGKTEKHEGEYEQVPFDKPYTGQLYFLIDGQGNSTTGHFMSLVKKHNLGITIGEELGSNQFCSAGQQTMRLKNTKIEYYVANNTHISAATSLPDEVGILPDHNVNQSIDQYMDGIDAVKNYAYNLIDAELSTNEEMNKDLLISPNNWGKETFRFPIRFAKELPYAGIEEAYFPPNWSNIDSSTFWTYAFVWKVKRPDLLSSEQICADLRIYFDGLMRIDDRRKEEGKEKDIDYTSATTEGEISNQNFNGTIHTFDGFTTKKMFELNFNVEQKLCDHTGELAILFRFSPKSLESDVWKKLKGIQFRKNICEY